MFVAGASARAAATRELTRRPRLIAVRAASDAVVRGAYARTGAGTEGITGILARVFKTHAAHSR